jgi:hypothetical protein
MEHKILAKIKGERMSQNCSVRWHQLSVEKWAGLLTEASQPGKYIYQVFRYSSGSLVPSYEVMSPSGYETFYKQLKTQTIDQRILEVAPNLIQICRLHTKKLALSKVVWLTERYLSDEAVIAYVNAEADGNNYTCKAFADKVFSQDMDVPQAIEQTFGPIHSLATALTSFYDRKVVPHRQGFFGKIRELISRIQAIVNKCLNDSFSEVWFARGSQSSCLHMISCVAEAKKMFAEEFLEALDDHVKRETVNSVELTTPSRPKGASSFAATPVLKQIATNSTGQDRANAEKMLRVKEKINGYLAKKT